MLERLFAADGPLARAHPAYRERPAQLVMAQGVEDVLARGGTLFCEAGTGTGKSLGYLVPAALSGRRVSSPRGRSPCSRSSCATTCRWPPRLAASRSAQSCSRAANYACRRMVVQLGMRLFDPLHGDAIERLRPWLDAT